MTRTPTLTTRRLTLRAPLETDLGAYKAFYAASDLTEGGYRGGRTAAEVVAILKRDIAHWVERGFGMFLLCRRDTNDAIGGVGLSHPDEWPSHELTWWLLPSARGHGFATEASRAVIDWAYGTLGWSRVETHMRDENARAHAMAKRLGGAVDRRELFPDGVTRDVYLLPRQEVEA